MRHPASIHRFWHRIVKFLVIVNDSPWGSTRAGTALRLSRAIVAAGHRLDCVFFREDGVYNVVTATAEDAETPNLARSWAELAQGGESALLVCQSSCQRRLASAPAAPFREAGLVELIDRLDKCDRVVTL